MTGIGRLNYPPVSIKLPEQPVTFIDEGDVVGKLEVEKVLVGDEAAINKNQLP
jgi:hypothetical protein